MLRLSLLTLLVAGCPRGSATDSPSGPAGPGAGGAATAAAASCQGGQVCTDHGATCRSGEYTCSCAPPCRGADMPEADNRPMWACRKVVRGCPEQLPDNGSRCRKEGLVCGYGTCGGASVTCTGGVWNVQEHGPPPSADG